MGVGKEKLSYDDYIIGSMIIYIDIILIFTNLLRCLDLLDNLWLKLFLYILIN